MKRTITITAYNRPKLLVQTLQRLLTNSLDGWRILVAIEPGEKAEELQDICRSFLDGRDVDIAVNPELRGVRGNPFALLKKAFSEGSDLNIYLEDDLFLSPDVIDLALWFQANHRPSWLCLNFMAGVCGSSGMLSEPALPDMLYEARGFNSLGFAVRRQEWERVMAPVWMPSTPERPGGRQANWRTHWGWDWSVYARLLEDPRMVTVQPVLARVNHAGAVGTWCDSAFQARAFDHLPINNARHTSFRLSPVEKLPSGVRARINLHNDITDLRLQMERETVRLGRELEGVYKRLRAILPK
jgi:hypothetical protein